MEPTVQSSGQAMTLMFKSDTSNTYKGFRLKYFETNSKFAGIVEIIKQSIEVIVSKTDQW